MDELNKLKGQLKVARDEIANLRYQQSDKILFFMHYNFITF